MLFFDCEVFVQDWLVVAMIADTQETVIIYNDKPALEAFYAKYKNDIWVGYNNRHYDQYIVQGILCDFNPKDINDFIIVEGKDGWQFSNLLRKFPILSYDVMLITDRGLKSFEGFMGNDIQETSVPFDLDRKLTDAEMQETIKYCIHDVEQTIQVFLRRTSEFNTMVYFIKHFQLPINYICKTKAQLAAEILGGTGTGDARKEFDIPWAPCLKLDKYKYIWDWYKDPANHSYSCHQKVTVAGIPHSYGWGGGHGAIKKYHDTGAFINIDVTAYYPSMQERFHFGYEVMSKPENFEFIHHSNLKFKAAGDKKARQPFKIMDNAISGQMKQPASKLFDPQANNAICINGELLLLDLVEKLEPYCSMIQNNTDGILIKPHNYNRDFDIIDDIVYEWEQRTGLSMEFDSFIDGEIYQKDVNNYFIIDRETGEYKSKGSYVMKLDDLSYDLPIINRALLAYMKDHIHPKDTIFPCDELKEFQLVAKASSKYSHILYGGKRIKEKCVRAFASKDPSDGGLVKVHATTGKSAKIANTPTHCFIYNDSVNGVKAPKKLDKQWYVALACKRLRDFGVDINEKRG